MVFNQRVVWIGSLVAALGVAGVVTYQKIESGPKVSYQTVAVDRGRITAKVTATGTLSALVTVQVGSQVSGRIQQINVDFNSPVKKGQVLAKLDPQLLQAALEQAKASYMAAESNLSKSQVQAADALRQLQRNKLLASRRLIAQADLDTSQANADAAEAQVKAERASVQQATASLHQAEVNLAYTTIYAPIDGVVISRNIDVGQTVAASLQSPTLFVIAQDMRKLQVDAAVAEADVGKLTANMPAEFTVDAYPNDKFTGTVRQIRNSPQTAQNVVTYDSVIDVSNPDLKLKPGMTANVTFIYADHPNVLRVPNAALRFHPSFDAQAAGSAPEASHGRGHRMHKPDGSDAKTVWVLADNKPKPIRVHTGLTDGSYTEIASGKLQVGDPLITDTQEPGAPSNSGGSQPFGGVKPQRIKGLM